MDIEVGHSRLASGSDADDDMFEANETDYQRHLSEALRVKPDAKIHTFSEKPPLAKEGRLKFLVVKLQYTVVG